MACKIDCFSLKEPLFRRNIRRINILPLPQAVRRGVNLVWKQVRGGILAFPQNIHIEVTNSCNLKCPMCVYPGQSRPRGFMDFGLFQKIIQQCQGEYFLEKMALMGLGEPFLHPELIKMSRYAKEHRVPHVYTSTNATLLDENQSMAILEKPGFDVLAISIDGATKQVYEQIRKGADFDKVVSHIISFISIRRKMRRRFPRLVLQFLIMRENYHQKDKFVEFWRDKLSNQDVILLRDVDTFGGQVPDHRLASQVPVNKRKPCIQLWRDLMISWNGDVTVCCKDVNYTLKLGNIGRSSIKELWHSKEWNNLRDLHRRCQWDKIGICANCSEWG